MSNRFTVPCRILATHTVFDHTGWWICRDISKNLPIFDALDVDLHQSPKYLEVIEHPLNDAIAVKVIKEFQWAIYNDQI